MLDFAFGDLFCGAGGTSRGATRAGGKSKFAYDLNYVQSEVYKANFGHCTNKSIQDVGVAEILALSDINLLCASPPASSGLEQETKIYAIAKTRTWVLIFCPSSPSKSLSSYF